MPRSRTLVDSSPQVMLLTIDFHEDFINEEGIAVTSVLTLQSRAYKAPNLMHQMQIDSLDTAIPRSASKSSISR